MTDTLSTPTVPPPDSGVVQSQMAETLASVTAIPKVYRTMKRDDDGYPTIESTAKGLGARPGPDIDMDPAGNVVLNGKGMSVAPGWRLLPAFRIPKRLMRLYPPARGADDVHCFKMGIDPFQRGAIAHGLELIPDSPAHGTIAPTAVMQLLEYEANLAATRTEWQVDEN